MSQFKITQLTPEQEALIPSYREKWRAITLSTVGRINHQKAEAVVKAAYKLFNFKEPKIIFFDSPYQALPAINTHLEGQVKLLHFELLGLGDEVEWNLCNQLDDQSCLQLDWGHELYNPQLESELDQLGSELDNEFHFDGEYECIKPEIWACNASWIDFCISVLGCTLNSNIYKSLLVFLSIIRCCGWIFPYANICFVCDRPRKLSFDSEYRLHAEGEPAIQFTDGYSLYFHHGVILPEKYRELHPNQWRSQWLLEENNAEFRRILIQGVGYSRIYQELQAIELDLWQEYTLLKIDNNVDVEPIYLLKMICPSTGFIHVLRVPPDMHSAREAIRWVNWETDPEEFSIQT